MLLHQSASLQRGLEDYDGLSSEGCRSGHSLASPFPPALALNLHPSLTPRLPILRFPLLIHFACGTLISLTVGHEGEGEDGALAADFCYSFAQYVDGK